MKFTPKVKTIIGLSIAVAAPSISMAVLFSVLTHKKLQSVTLPTFSLNPKTPNVLFIYSDGMDDRVINDVKNDKELSHTFDDFYKFNKLRAMGSVTYYNLNLLKGDIRNNSWASLYRKEGHDPDRSHFQKQISKGINSFVRSLDHIYEKTQGTSKSIINLEEDVVHEDGINHLSFDGIKKALFSNGWGVKSISAVSAAYKFLQKSHASSKAKPAFVFSADLITHIAYTDKYGDYKWHFGASLRDAVKSKSRYLNNLFLYLKSLKDGNANAYDNTLIVVWGDHANHSIDTSTWEGFARKTNPSFFIKYPHQSFSHYKELDDYTITQPQIRKIVEDYFINKSQYLNGVDPITFFEKYKDTNFKVDRKTLIFKGSSYTLGSYVGDKYVQSKSYPWASFMDLSDKQWNSLVDKYEEWHD